jgi:hypothetical protein
MQIDIFGNSLSLTNAATRDEWDKMQLGFLAHSSVTPTHLAAVLEAEPNFALAHATKGLFYLMLGRRELTQTALQAFSDAQAALKITTATLREQKFVFALGHWLQKRPSAARDCMEDVLSLAPQDALAMKISHAISFILGDSADMRRSIEAVLPSYDESHKAFGYLHGCHAFTLEETGEYELAEAAGIKGMHFAPDDAWGLHAVAHVYDMTANAKSGLEWLSTRESAWAHCNNFRYHVWWHKALMHLDQGQVDEVFALYDNEIRKEKTDDYRDISNATSLLSRMELEGINVGNRWEELADLSENRTADGCLIFADLHYMLALVGGERDVAIQSMMARMNTDATDTSNDINQAIADPGLAAAAGLEAFGEANYEVAFRNLLKARCNLQSAGGSHAQRDVFERLTIDSGIRGGFLSEARTILNERKARRGGTEDRYAAVRFEMISANLNNDGSGQHVAAE